MIFYPSPVHTSRYSLQLWLRRISQRFSKDLFGPFDNRAKKWKGLGRQNAKSMNCPSPVPLITERGPLLDQCDTAGNQKWNPHFTAFASSLPTLDFRFTALIKHQQFRFAVVLLLLPVTLNVIIIAIDIIISVIIWRVGYLQSAKFELFKNKYVLTTNTTSCAGQ